MLIITTPYGDTYLVHDNGDISRQNRQTGRYTTPSGEWKMLGIEPVRGATQEGARFIPLDAITQEWLDLHPLTYNNRNPRYTVVDLDHGTKRTWGNTKYHGIRSIRIVDMHPDKALRLELEEGSKDEIRQNIRLFGHA